MAKKFQISSFAEAIGNVSRPDTSGRDQIEYIDIDLIDNDPKNFYTLSGLDELASNIALLGLQQPLRVRPNPEDPQRVIIVSGHRRRAAIRTLIDEGRTDLTQIPCIREAPAQSAALQELRLIYANSDTRTRTVAELGRQAERVEELLYLLKEEGLEFPGRMRDHVAEACRVSAPKLARLKVIRENLVPEYMALWDQGNLPEVTAYALARMPAEFQRRLASVLSEPPAGNTAEKILKKYQEGWRWEPELLCPDGKPCRRGDAFLRRDCEAGSYTNLCGGQTCCLTCDRAVHDWFPCERMCSKAKAQRKAVNDEKKRREHLEKQNCGQNYQKETQGYARRLLLAVDAAGLADDAAIAWRTYGSVYFVSEIRQWAAGEFNDPADWYSARLVPDECSNAPSVSKLLGCSTDYLLGLTDSLQPAAPEPAYGDRPEYDCSSQTLAVSKLDTMPDDEPEEGTDDGPAEAPARLIRWEGRGRKLPEGKPILTYGIANGGPIYRTVVCEGGQFKRPDRKRFVTGLQYTKWLEIPPPDSGESLQLAPPEQPVGQLMISGWMPGGTSPRQPCDIVADFRVPGTSGAGESNLRRICWFDGTGFLFRRHGSRIDAECVRWMALPPVEDDVSKSDTTGETL